MSVRPGRAHAIALAVLLVLFLFRVIAQLVQAVWPNEALPPFDAWHSATLPYPILVASQVVIAALMVWLVRRLWRLGALGGPRLRAGLWAFGAFYLFFATVRFIGGFTFAPHNTFMAAHLPAFFHIVLASAVIVVASYASKRAKMEAAT